MLTQLHGCISVSIFIRPFCNGVAVLCNRTCNPHLVLRENLSSVYVLWECNSSVAACLILEFNEPCELLQQMLRRLCRLGVMLSISIHVRVVRTVLYHGLCILACYDVWPAVSQVAVCGLLAGGSV
jgi:hypothetical protein